MLNHYLFDSKFNLNTKKIIHVVMETRHLTWTRWLHLLCMPISGKSPEKNPDEIYLPLINIPAEDFKAQDRSGLPVCRSRNRDFKSFVYR